MNNLENYRFYYRHPPCDEENGFIETTSSFENHRFRSPNLKPARRNGRTYLVKPYYLRFYAPEKILNQVEEYLVDFNCRKEN